MVALVFALLSVLLGATGSSANFDSSGKPKSNDNKSHRIGSDVLPLTYDSTFDSKQQQQWGEPQDQEQQQQEQQQQQQRIRRHQEQQDWSGWPEGDEEEEGEYGENKYDDNGNDEEEEEIYDNDDSYDGFNEEEDGDDNYGDEEEEDDRYDHDEDDHNNEYDHSEACFDDCDYNEADNGRRDDDEDCYNDNDDNVDYDYDGYNDSDHDNEYEYKYEYEGEDEEDDDDEEKNGDGHGDKEHNYGIDETDSYRYEWSPTQIEQMDRLYKKYIDVFARELEEKGGKPEGKEIIYLRYLDHAVRKEQKRLIEVENKNNVHRAANMIYEDSDTHVRGGLRKRQQDANQQDQAYGRPNEEEGQTTEDSYYNEAQNRASQTHQTPDDVILKYDPLYLELDWEDFNEVGGDVYHRSNNSTRQIRTKTTRTNVVIRVVANSTVAVPGTVSSATMNSTRHQRRNQQQPLDAAVKPIQE